MTDDLLPDAEPGDDPTDADLSVSDIELISAALRDVPPSARRADHVTAALAVFDELGAAASTNPAHPTTDVIPLRRPADRRVATRRLAAAAAVVLVVGVGIGLAVRGSNGNDASDTSASIAEAGRTPSTAGGEAPEVASDAATPPGPVSTVDGTPVDYGAVPDDAALAAAVDATTSAAKATDRAGEAAASAAGAPAPSTFDTFSGSSTTLAPSAAPLGSCSAAVPPGTVVLGTATVAGRPVVVISLAGGDGSSARTVMDLTDCSTRPL